ncbi:hypothetical protein GCM10010201_20280 [Pilimelia columellifera subsp. columellifera]|uniref:Uncharacterized protein n=1 Tax=Pilimelia columellifera subsp. columellifera TaxID=706583 RepID=A0ABN3NI91_9ACTN
MVEAVSVDYLVEVDDPPPRAVAPDVTLPALHERRDLRIWSEMVSDGVLALDRVGALDPATGATPTLRPSISSTMPPTPTPVMSCARPAPTCGLTFRRHPPRPKGGAVGWFKLPRFSQWSAVYIHCI